jgi:hypothetical protein
MRGDTLQTFQKKFQNNSFFIKKSRFQDFCYKKLMRGDKMLTFQKNCKNNFFSLKNVDFK